jgi:hypothetical protein
MLPIPFDMCQINFARQLAAKSHNNRRELEIRTPLFALNLCAQIMAYSFLARYLAIARRLQVATRNPSLLITLIK